MNYTGKVSYKTVNRVRMLNTLPISKLQTDMLVQDIWKAINKVNRPVE